MADEKENISKELDHLERTYKSGLIGESEYIKYQKAINKKLDNLKKAKANKEKQKEFIEKTLGGDIMVDNKKVEKNTIDKNMVNKHDKVHGKLVLNKQALKEEKEENLKKSIKNKPETKSARRDRKVNDNKNKQESKDEKNKTANKPESVNKLESNQQSEKSDNGTKKALKGFDSEIFGTSKPKSKIWNWLILILLIVLSWQLYNIFFVSSSQAVPQDKSLTIYEYTDFACDYCAEVQKALRDVYDYYQGAVQIELKHYPISKGETSLQAAYYVECMRKVAETRYDFLFQRHLFSKGSELRRADFADFIGTFDVDSNALGECLDSDYPKEEVSKDVKDANDLGITSVPTVVIGDKKIVGSQPFEVYKYYIDQELKAKQE